MVEMKKRKSEMSLGNRRKGRRVGVGEGGVEDEKVRVVRTNSRLEVDKVPVVRHNRRLQFDHEVFVVRRQRSVSLYFPNLIFFV